MNDAWHYETKHFINGIEITWARVGAVAIGLVVVVVLTIVLARWMRKGS